MAKRYAVIDKSGVCVNHILIDDPMPKGYWPGYGNYLLCLEANPDLKNPAGLTVLNITPDKSFQIGDTINIQSGSVTKFASQQIIQKDEKGQDITVNSAPVVVLAKDVEPTKADAIADAGIE